MIAVDVVQSTIRSQWSRSQILTVSHEKVADFDRGYDRLAITKFALIAY